MIEKITAEMKDRKKILLYSCIILNFFVAFGCAASDKGSSTNFKRGAFKQAKINGELANEGFRRCRRYVYGWLRYADSNTGLIPRGIKGGRRDIWNPEDAAADNYPFMVLTSAITDRKLFEGKMKRMLRAEKRFTSRLGVLPDDYSFSRGGFASDEPDVGRIIFGASEYIKDGLLPLTEWLGQSEWSQRMIEMLDEIFRRAPVQTKFGPIPSKSNEINGEMLQALSRMYWMTGRREYLDYAIRLGDYYLLGGHHPTRDQKKLRLRDHGCEIVSGLCELYATVHFARPEKASAYQEPIHEMLDRILKVGRNDHGLFYNSINPQTGSYSDGVSDSWGYNLNGYYTVYLIDKTQKYRDAVLKALGSLKEHYTNFKWEGDSADGYADSIESAINLYNREPVDSAAGWIDSETERMWGKQRPDGIIEGWHGDGNFARTTIMYCLWKTKGVTVRPWRKDIIFGAVQEGQNLKMYICANKKWQGRVVFDIPRHRKNMKMPLDWPRINQFQQWFTVETGNKYLFTNLTSATKKSYTGGELNEGITLSLEEDREYYFIVTPQVK